MGTSQIRYLVNNSDSGSADFYIGTYEGINFVNSRYYYTELGVWGWIMSYTGPSNEEYGEIPGFTWDISVADVAYKTRWLASYTYTHYGFTTWHSGYYTYYPAYYAYYNRLVTPAVYKYTPSYYKNVLHYRYYTV